MRSFWLIARFEYRRMVFRRAFVLLTLAIPAGMAILITLAILVAISSEDRSPIGFRDASGLIKLAPYAELQAEESRLEIRAYDNFETGMAALTVGEIQALFVLPATYPEAGQVEVYYQTEEPSGDVWRDFRDLLRLSLLASYPNEIANRLFVGSDITVHDSATGRTFGENAIINIVLPFAASFLFFVATTSASGYMLQIIADEKENRTIEMMLTSVSPNQLLAGKMSGLLLAALTQLAIYLLAAVIGLALATPRVSELQPLEVPWVYLGIMLAFFLPAYLLIAAVMAAIGSVVSELPQGQQIAGILNLLFMAPIFLLALIFENPSAPILIFFSFFPTTSFLTISLRWGVASVPFWQLGPSWLLLTTSALLMVWLAARAFQQSMLRYGQPIRLLKLLRGKVVGSG